VADNKTIHPGKICLGLFWEVMRLMKKSKKSAKNPDSSALQNIPAQDPHADFSKKDANFKKSRGAQS